jgi:hypothetical protein
MTIYVVKTFRGYWVTASEEEAELIADKLYEELQYDCREHRVVSENVWCRIDIYHAKDNFGMPFVYRDSRWANKM